RRIRQKSVDNQGDRGMMPYDERPAAAPVAPKGVRWEGIYDFVRSKLTWDRVYRATSYFKSALWTVPIIAIVLELVLAPLLRELGGWLQGGFFVFQAPGRETLSQAVT